MVKKAVWSLGSWLADRYGGELKVFVDTARVREKPLAAAAGLGWQGKHTNLLSREHGNWLFLGIVMTSLELAPDAPAEEHCGSCTRCIDACPTAAITAPGQIDARRCISYLTIQHAGPIPAKFRPATADRIHGRAQCVAGFPCYRFRASASPDRPFRPPPASVTPRHRGPPAPR